jgi:hypothetical protein
MSQVPEPGRYDVRLYRCSVRISIISLLASCLPIDIPHFPNPGSDEKERGDFLVG